MQGVKRKKKKSRKRKNISLSKREIVLVKLTICSSALTELQSREGMEEYSPSIEYALDQIGTAIVVLLNLPDRRGTLPDKIRARVDATLSEVHKLSESITEESVGSAADRDPNLYLAVSFDFIIKDVCGCLNNKKLKEIIQPLIETSDFLMEILDTGDVDIYDTARDFIECINSVIGDKWQGERLTLEG